MGWKDTLTQCSYITERCLSIGSKQSRMEETYYHLYKSFGRINAFTANPVMALYFSILV